MSEPMRFSLKHHGQLSCVEHCPEGEYVLHSDYARLKAEVERLERLVNYWKIEANCDHDRWLRVLADLDDLRRNMK